MDDSGRVEHVNCRRSEEELLRKCANRERWLVLCALLGGVIFFSPVCAEDGPTISTEMFSGGKVSIFVQVDTVETFELACDDPLAAVRCGTEPLVLHPGSRSSWIYNSRQWHLIFLDLGDRESAL